MDELGVVAEQAQKQQGFNKSENTVTSFSQSNFETGVVALSFKPGSSLHRLHTLGSASDSKSRHAVL